VQWLSETFESVIGSKLEHEGSLGPKKVQHRHKALQDILDLVETKLAEMLGRNPQRMDNYKKYQIIIADYNREKDRATVEETFAKVAKLASEVDAELQRHVREGLSEDEPAFFDLLLKKEVSKVEREQLKQASKGLLAVLKERIASMPNWTMNATTQADVRIVILDTLYESLPRPLFTDEDADSLTERLYGLVWQRSNAGTMVLLRQQCVRGRPGSA